MGIESDAQKDLQLSDEDAESVVGGKKKKTKKHETRQAAGSTIPSSFPVSSTGKSPPRTPRATTAT